MLTDRIREIISKKEFLEEYKIKQKGVNYNRRYNVEKFMCPIEPAKDIYIQEDDPTNSEATGFSTIFAHYMLEQYLKIIDKDCANICRIKSSALINEFCSIDFGNKLFATFVTEDINTPLFRIAECKGIKLLQVVKNTVGNRIYLIDKITMPYFEKTNDKMSVTIEEMNDNSNADVKEYKKGLSEGRIKLLRNYRLLVINHCMEIVCSTRAIKIVVDDKDGEDSIDCIKRFINY